MASSLLFEAFRSGERLSLRTSPVRENYESVFTPYDGGSLIDFRHKREVSEVDDIHDVVSVPCNGQRLRGRLKNIRLDRVA